MSEASQVIELDPKDFKLNDYDNVCIQMPLRPALTKEDIDAQLFEYVISGGKDIQSLADLDDDWVKANFEGLETIDEVRTAIVDDYNKSMEFEESDIKFRACCDALLDRLEGEIAPEILEHDIAVMHESNAQRLAEMHMSIEQYLREEQLTREQYEDKVRDETIYQLRLNVALDIMADVLGTQVGNHEITEYLSSPNPKKFIEEIRENGQVENARRAAVRVKVMRRIVDTAVIEEKIGEEPAPQPTPVADDDEDFEMPDFENLPPAQIKNDAPNRFTVEPLI